MAAAVASSSAARSSHVKMRAPVVEIEFVGRANIKFVLSGTDASVANALRRAMIAETPCLAISTVEIEHNTTALHDEFLVHRMGLIPLRFTDTESDVGAVFGLDDPHNEDVDEVLLVLDVQNDGSPRRIVTSHDLELVPQQPHHELVEVAHTASEEEAALLSSIGHGDEETAAAAEAAARSTGITDAESGITIVKLGPWQRLTMRCYANVGYGKIHARYIPVSTAVMRYDYEIEINSAAVERLRPAQRAEFVEQCPIGLLEFSEADESVRVADVSLLNNPTELKRLAQNASVTDEPLLRVTAREGRFLFEVETTGALTAVQVVRGAMAALINKLETIRQEVATSSGAAGDVEGDEGVEETAAAATAVAAAAAAVV